MSITTYKMLGFKRQKVAVLSKIVIGICILLLGNNKSLQAQFKLNFHDNNQFLIQKNKDIDTGKIHSQLMLSRDYYLRGDLNNAQLLLQQTIHTCQENGYDYGLIKGHIGVGNIHSFNGKYVDALKAYSQALILASYTNPQLLSLIYQNIGNLYLLRADYRQSMNFYKKALLFLYKTNAEISLAQIYSNIAVPINYLHLPNQAIEYLLIAKTFAEQEKNDVTLANIYTNLSNSYHQLNDTFASLNSTKKALEIAIKKNLPDNYKVATTNLGIYEMNRNNLKKALDYFRLAQKEPTAFNQFNYTIWLLGIGATYLKLKNYDSANYYLEKVIESPIAQQQKQHQITAHELLAHSNGERKNFEQGFFHLVQHKWLTDSIFKIENVQTVAEISTQFKTMVKEKEIAEQKLIIQTQQNNIEQNKKMMIIAAISIIIILLIIFYQWKLYKQKQKIKNDEIVYLQQKQNLAVMKAVMQGEESARTSIARELHDSIMTQLSIIKMQLNKNLNTAEDTISKSAFLPITDMIDTTSRALRNTAHQLMPDNLVEEGLANALLYYCTQLQPNLPFLLTFQTIGNIPRFTNEFELSIYRIIQELVQNIIKHAKAKHAIVQLSYDEDHSLHLTIEDDGIGMTDSTKNTGGLGLKSIRNRIHQFGGTFHMDSEMDIGTTITISFEQSALLNQHFYS